MAIRQVGVRRRLGSERHAAPGFITCAGRKTYAGSRTTFATGWALSGCYPRPAGRASNGSLTQGQNIAGLYALMAANLAVFYGALCGKRTGAKPQRRCERELSDGTERRRANAPPRSGRRGQREDDTRSAQLHRGVSLCGDCPRGTTCPRTPAVTLAVSRRTGARDH
jgi:hypothetical protein